jgi:hypothetical protein
MGISRLATRQPEVVTALTWAPLFSYANRALGVGSGCHRGGQQPSGQRMRGETAIEPVGDRAQVALGVLAKVEGMVRAAQAALHIAKDRIDPVQQGVIRKSPQREGPVVDEAFRTAPPLQLDPDFRKRIATVVSGNSYCRARGFAGGSLSSRPSALLKR